MIIFSSISRNYLDKFSPKVFNVLAIIYFPRTKWVPKSFLTRAPLPYTWTVGSVVLAVWGALLVVLRVVGARVVVGAGVVVVVVVVVEDILKMFWLLTFPLNGWYTDSNESPDPSKSSSWSLFLFFKLVERPLFGETLMKLTAAFLFPGSPGRDAAGLKFLIIYIYFYFDSMN